MSKHIILFLSEKFIYFNNKSQKKITDLLSEVKKGNKKKTNMEINNIIFPKDAFMKLISHAKQIDIEI